MDCERYYPLAEGKFWSYRMTFGGQDAGTVRQHVKAGRRSTNSSFWKMERQMAGAEAERYPVVVSGAEVRIATAVMLRAPLETGATWRDTNEGGELVFEVTRAGFADEVPAGRYDGCVEVTARRDGVEVQRTVYAPGTGMIRHRAPVPGGWLELVLEETGQIH